MTPAIIKPVEDHDASFILEEMAKADAADIEAHVHRKAAGQRLLAKKAVIGHGNWLPWLQANSIHPRQAQRCMAVALGKNDTLSHLPPEPDPVAVEIGRVFRQAQQHLKNHLKEGGAWEPWMANALWSDSSEAS